jgi:SAM-dependent methyltransferase
MTELLAPRLDRLERDVMDVLPYADSLARAHDDPGSNGEGGDVARWGSLRSIVRHMANYVSAATLTEQLNRPVRDMLDIGCGTAALSAWMADRLSADLHLHDHDTKALDLAARAFSVKSASPDLLEAPRADLVVALEVVEHVPPSAQRVFIEQAFSRVNPGGLLVVSTPDETSYPFGSSAYPPHIGTLSESELGDLLHDATGRTPQVWRLEGGAFDISLVRRHCEWVGNHLLRYKAVQSSVRFKPRRMEPISHGSRRLRRLADVRVGRSPGRGTGLVALVR